MLKVPTDGPLLDLSITDIVEELSAGDLMVLNDTRVIPARLLGRKDSGGKVEILLERIVDQSHVVAQVKASRAPKPGQRLMVDDDDDSEAAAKITVVGREGSFFILEITVAGLLEAWFERVGHMPLPPYIERPDEQGDIERYQTVFSRQAGAVAAPTAGLHYDHALLEQLRHKGVEIATLTLHVGAGTYQPVRAETIEEHSMHSERIEVSQSLCDKVIATRERGGRIMAVGTTVVRSLETAACASKRGLIEPFSGETDIFIYPGFKFAVVDMLQTNFHLPQSTLLMLVSAFAGKDRVMQAYQHAIEQEYRFFSYGDAMLLERLT
jgi:S-adenosylmethionine:tRNA ribosyltransferase-isomerase